jgi:hypothetical protein
MLGVEYDSREFEYFRLSEVNYIKLVRLRKNSEQIPLYYTSYGRFIPLLTLKDLEKALRPHGFKMMDGSHLVNQRRIKGKDVTPQGEKITFIDSCEVNVSPRTRMK